MADFWAECVGPGEQPKVDVPQNKRSRRSKASQGQPGDKASEGQPGEGLSFEMKCGAVGGKRKMVYKMKCCALVTGKPCNLCSQKDSDVDPVVPTTPRLWGDYRWTTEEDRIAVAAQVATHGATCFYCMKGYVTYFKGSKKMSELKTEMGTNQETHEMFHRVVAWLIKFMLDKVTADPLVGPRCIVQNPVAQHD